MILRKLFLSGAVLMSVLPAYADVIIEEDTPSVDVSPVQLIGKPYADNNLVAKAGDTMTGPLIFDVPSDINGIKTPLIVKGASRYGDDNMSLEFAGGVFSIKDGSDYTLLQIGRGKNDGVWYMEGGVGSSGGSATGMRLGRQDVPYSNMWSESIQAPGGKRLMIPEFPSYSCGSQGMDGTDCQLVAAPVPAKAKGADKMYILRDRYNGGEVHSYKWSEFPIIPDSLPTADGTYVLKVTIKSGKATGAWVKQ